MDVETLCWNLIQMPAQEGITVIKACRRGDVCRKTYYKWKNRFQQTIFIPFDDFGDEKKMRAHGRFIKTLLKHMNIPFSSLTEALRNLIFYCDQQGDESSIITFFSGIGIGGAAFAAGITNPVGWFLILLTSGVAGMTDFQWDSWRDKIFYFLDFIEEL